MGGSSVPHARSAWPGPPSEALPGLAGVSLGAWGEGCANLDNCEPTACTGDVIPVRRGHPLFHSTDVCAVLFSVFRLHQGIDGSE